MTDNSHFLFEFAILAVLCWVSYCMMHAGLKFSDFLTQISIPVMTMLILGFFLDWKKDKARWVIGIAFCIYVLVECGIGAAQLFGLTPSHDGLVSGTFHSSKNYGAMIGMAYILSTAVIRRYQLDGIKRGIFGVIKLICVIMMILSGSKGAWIATILTVVLIICRETNTLKLIKFYKKGMIVCLVIVAIAVAVLCIIFPKPIVDMVHFTSLEVKVMCDNPIFGVGAGNELQALREAQVSYNISHGFSADSNLPFEIRNEFLRAGMNSGIVGLVLMLFAAALSIIAFRLKRSLLEYPLIMLMIFSLFGNPLTQMQLCLALAFCMGDAAALISTDRGRYLLSGVLTVIVCLVLLPYAKDSVSRFVMTGMVMSPNANDDILQDKEVLPAELELFDYNYGNYPH